MPPFWFPLGPQTPYYVMAPTLSAIQPAGKVAIAPSPFVIAREAHAGMLAAAAAAAAAGGPGGVPGTAAPSSGTAPSSGAAGTSSSASASGPSGVVHIGTVTAAVSAAGSSSSGGVEGLTRKVRLPEAQQFSLSNDDPTRRFLATTHLNNKKLMFMRLDTVEKPASKCSGPTLRARCKLVRELIQYLAGGAAGGTPDDERIFRAALAKSDKEAHLLALKDIGLLSERPRKAG